MAQYAERLRFGEVEVLVKASAVATGGAFSIFEEHEPVDTPLHVHAHEDELFYVLEGEHVFTASSACWTPPIATAGSAPRPARPRRAASGSPGSRTRRRRARGRGPP